MGYCSTLEHLPSHNHILSSISYDMSAEGLPIWPITWLSPQHSRLCCDQHHVTAVPLHMHLHCTAEGMTFKPKLHYLHCLLYGLYSLRCDMLQYGPLQCLHFGSLIFSSLFCGVMILFGTSFFILSQSDDFVRDLVKSDDTTVDQQELPQSVSMSVCQNRKHEGMCVSWRYTSQLQLSLSSFKSNSALCITNLQLYLIDHPSTINTIPYKNMSPMGNKVHMLLPWDASATATALQCYNAMMTIASWHR